MMKTKKKKETKKIAACSAKSEVETEPKKLSPLGEWIRKHPHGFGDVIINDPSILHG
jgi:hypothetical protein